MKFLIKIIMILMMLTTLVMTLFSMFDSYLFIGQLYGADVAPYVIDSRMDAVLVHIAAALFAQGWVMMLENGVKRAGLGG